MRLKKKDVGTRLLISEKPTSIRNPIEVKILDVSPSGKYVKIHPINGSKHWVEQSEYELIEVLYNHDKISNPYEYTGIDIAINEDDELVINGIPFDL